VKLGDFGSAQQLVDLIHNQNEKKKGTPCYMAPELFEVGSVYSFSSDLWALGCILYELAQGNPPFVSTSLHDIATLAKTAETPKVEFFSSDFNNLLEKLLCK
jgi:serine/threonine-protein kinase ULK4